MTDQERSLLTGCLKGEKAAWDAFVLQYSALVYHTIRKFLTLHHTEPRDDLVEDLYQDVFLSLCENGCKKLGQFRGDRGCTLASWLRVVTSRRTIDFLRRQPPPASEVPDRLARDAPDPTESLISSEEEKLLDQTIHALSPRDHILLDLCYRQDLSAEEIAVLLKTSVNVIYTQKSRLLDKIRAAILKARAL